MTLVRYDPRRSLLRFNEDFDWNLNPFSPAFFEGFGRFSQDWRPSVDISENDEKIIVKAEIAGMKKDDIHDSLKNDVLTIEGEKTANRDEEQDNLHISERRYGKFIRSFKLPAQVDRKKIEASYKDGVLTLELPKTEEAKPKEIEINLH